VTEAMVSGMMMMRSMAAPFKKQAGRARAAATCGMVLLIVCGLLACAEAYHYDLNDTAAAAGAPEHTVSGEGVSGGVSGAAAVNTLIKSALSHMNLTDMLNGFGAPFIAPSLLTTLVSQWLGSANISKSAFDYNYASDAYSFQQENVTLVDFIGKLATDAVEEIVQPGADLCVSS